jgi:CRISPR-associated protein Cas1
MQLFLDSFGASLSVKNGMFSVKPKNSEPRLFPIREINAIFLTRGVSVTTGALMLAIRNSIPVLLIDEIGHPVGQVWSGQFGSIATIRKNQALFANDIQGMYYIRELLLQKVSQQMEALRSLSPEGPVSQSLEKALPGMEGIRQKFAQWDHRGESRDELASQFRGWEGTASRYYFEALSAALPPPFQFKGRSKRPAFDPFNALLNYLYGILYAYVELALMKAGLDPYTGILHADEYNRPTLVFDQIEIYRQWADLTACRLASTGSLPPDTFTDTETEGVRMIQPGKGIAVEAFLETLNEKTEYKGQLRRRQTHIDLDAQRLAARLKEFKPGSQTSIF